MREDLKAIKSGKKELREFGLVVGGILLLLGGIALWRGKGSYPYLFAAGGFLVAGGLFLPIILLPFQKVWMAFAVVAGFVMSRVILSVLFYLVITPIAGLLHLFGKDILNQRIDRAAQSYWQTRPAAAKPKASYENQY